MVGLIVAVSVIAVVVAVNLAVGIANSDRFYTEKGKRIQTDKNLLAEINSIRQAQEDTNRELRRLRDADFERSMRDAERSLRRPEADGDYRLRVARSLNSLGARIRALEPKEPSALVAQTFDVAVTVTPRKGY
jgi:hypothetical protein